jgi:hypothetical protein
MGHILKWNDQHQPGVPKQKHNQGPMDQSGNTVLINPSCYIRTMDHVIWADESETVEIQMEPMSLARELTAESTLRWSTKPEDQVQWRVWLQWALREIGPTAINWGQWDFHLTGSHDPDHSCGLPSGTPYMEKMLQTTRTDHASPIGTTDAKPQPQAYQQGHQINHNDPDFNQHLIRRTPKNGRCIVNYIQSEETSFGSLMKSITSFII